MLRENKEGKKWIDLFFLVKIGSRGTWKSLSNKVNFVAWSLTFGSNICSKCLKLVTHTPTFTNFPRGYHGYPVNMITNEEGTVDSHGLQFTNIIALFFFILHVHNLAFQRNNYWNCGLWLIGDCNALNFR